MLRLRIISPPGGEHVVPRLPCVVGRAAPADVRLELPGIWNEHFRIEQNEAAGFTLAVVPPAALSLNGRSHQAGRLRNGDIIGAGGVEIEFGFTHPQPKNLALRESLVWLLLAAITLGEVGWLYVLLR